VTKRLQNYPRPYGVKVIQLLWFKNVSFKVTYSQLVQLYRDGLKCAQGVGEEA
jgi:hypothetical protein